MQYYLVIEWEKNSTEITRNSGNGNMKEDIDNVDNHMVTSDNSKSIVGRYKRFNPTRFYAINFWISKQCEICNSNKIKSRGDVLVCRRLIRRMLC